MAATQEELRHAKWNHDYIADIAILILFGLLITKTIGSPHVHSTPTKTTTSDSLTSRWSPLRLRRGPKPDDSTMPGIES